MASYNKVILIGNLTRDPELRYSAKGTAIAKIGIAVNRRWRNEAGEWQEEVTYVDVDAFGRSAETIGQYLKKGRPIMVEGRLRLDQWEDKNSGQKRSRNPSARRSIGKHSISTLKQACETLFKR